VSVSAFFIDKTEVNNKPIPGLCKLGCRFVAITDYLHDDSFTCLPPAPPLGPRNKEIRLIDWSKVNKISPLWKKAPPEVKEKLAPIDDPA